MAQTDVSWPMGSSQMADRVRRHDWTSTPLGPIEGWSERFRVMVEQMLAIPFVSSLVCGPERILVYNDAAAKLYGEQHPGALGQPLPKTFPEGWAMVAGLYERAFGGETVQVLEQPLDIRGTGEATNVFDALLTPVHEADGRVAYVHMVGSEMGKRARVDAALRESEKRYRSLFERMGQGYCKLELLRDENGRAVNQRYIAFNPAFERLFDIPVAEATGRTASEVFPGLESWWHEAFDRVARQGQPERIEHDVVSLGRSFEVYVYPTGADRLTVLYEDVTQRRNADVALRESEERHTYLLRLSDVLRPLADPIEIIGAATRLLGEGLGASRAYYAEWPPGTDYVEIRRDYAAPGLPSLVGRYPIEFFRSTDERFREGQTWVVEDVADGTIAAAERDYCLAHGVAAWVDVPLVKGGDLQAALFLVQDAPRCWSATEIALAEETAERTWAAVERARIEAALRASEERFAQFTRASAAGLWIRDAATLAIEYASPAIQTIYGVLPEAILGDPKQWAALIVPEDRGAALEQLGLARNEKAVTHEFRILRPSDGAFRWIRDTDFPLRDEQGRVQRIGGIAEDVTEAKQAAEHQTVLLLELQHRVRNILAMTRSVAHQTGDTAGNVEDYRNLLEGRLRALARVQTLLTRAANVGVDLATLIRAEVEAQAVHERQSTLSGPEVVLSPKAAEVLTLAIHELATNALKYGAFSHAAGHLAVSWHVIYPAEEPWLRLDWVETGAPAPLPPPQREGFGTILIQGRIPYELKGRGHLALEGDGMRCRLEFPLRRRDSILETDTVTLSTTIAGGSLDMTGEADLSGCTVLVVEDDFYLARDTERAVRNAGGHVLGPVGDEDDALSLLASEAPTCALVDINLGYGAEFRLAEALQAAGVPFVFVTGYDDVVIPTRFDNVARLRKPTDFREIVRAAARMSSGAM